MMRRSLARTVQGKQAVVFDLFHTLTSLESTWGDGRPFTHQMLGVSKEAWHEQLLERSRDRLVGRERDPIQIVAAMAHAIDPAIRPESIRAAVANRIERFAAALTNVPQETIAVLEALKARGQKLGLISNADVMEVAAWHRSPIAPVFGAAVFSCEVGCVKPEPEIYRLCLDRLGVRPAQCVFVGDGGSRELEGARALGLTTVMITGIIREIWPEKIEERERHADFVIERLSELLPPGDARP